MQSIQHIGLDFGTTNSALAVADAAGAVTVARFVPDAGERETFRSVLHFLCDDGPRGATTIEAGPRAIARWLALGAEGRLIQSIKTFLASRAFHETTICDRPWTLEG